MVRLFIYLPMPIQGVVSCIASSHLDISGVNMYFKKGQAFVISSDLTISFG